MVLVIFSRLEEILAPANHLKNVPASFFNIKELRHLNLVNNDITTLLPNDYVTEQFDIDDAMHDDVIWQCYSLKCLNLARNQLTAIPNAIHAANSLEKLVLCQNRISSFPVGWKCPLVSTSSFFAECLPKKISQT